MRKLFAIDWDDVELRYVEAYAASGELRQVRCVVREWDAADETGHAPGSIEALSWTLSQEGLGGGLALLVARRQHLETFSLTLPPSEDNELPQLVEAQIAAQQTNLQDDFGFDYVSLDDSPEAPRRVIAVAAQLSTLQQYRQLIGAAGLKKLRVAVRPLASASLLNRMVPGSEGATLVVTPLAEEIDVGLVVDQTLWFWRTIYSSPPTHSEAFLDFFKAELLRTVAVAEQYLPEGQQIRQAAVFTGSGHDSLIPQAMEAALPFPVTHVDPSSAAESIQIDDAQPISKFAPLLGLLADEAAGMRPVVDLMQPRRPKVERPYRRPLLLGIAAAIFAVALGGFWIWEEVQTAQSRVDELAIELEGLRAEVKRKKIDAAIVDLVAAWERSGIVWLDELRDLSLKFPPPQDAVVLDVSGSPARSGGAIIRMHGRVREPSIVTALDQILRDEYRDILSRNFHEESVRQTENGFAWRFESLITTLRRPQAVYVAAQQESATGGDPFFSLLPSGAPLNSARSGATPLR